MTFNDIRNYYREEEYPALAWEMRAWGKKKPLAGIRILDATPVFRNTVIKYMALLEAGATLTVGISDVMPYDREIVQMLQANGIAVVHSNETPTAQDIILDCAGAFSTWEARIGVSELTRSGAYVYADVGKPVFLADEGRIKRIETCLGTGDGFFRAMETLGYTDWKDRRIVVFGSGKVGTGIIYKAAKLGAIVDVVTDPKTVSPFMRSFIHNVVDFNQPEEVNKVIQNAYILVTATGIKGAVEKYCSPDVILQTGALLANMGVEDEYGDSFPATAVLNEKRPLNFILEEPTLIRYIEATMALHNEGALYLLNHSPLASDIIIPPAEIEAAILTITRNHGMIADELDLIDKIKRESY